MSRRLACSLMLVAGLALVPGAPAPSRDSLLAKADRALRQWAQRGGPDVARVLVQARPGTGLRVQTTWRQGHRHSPVLVAAHDLLVADVSLDGLRQMANDEDVLHLSLDAPVRSLGLPVASSSNTLLATEGLLPRRYSGANVGVALVDSGFLPSADFGKVTASFIATHGVVTKQGPKDPYGHGTHVAGLVASTGSTSTGLYQGIAPGSRLTILRVLDANGAGYTSDVIAAIDYAVANRVKLGIDIINLSLGHPIYEPAATDPLVQAVERAVAAGVVVVVSAGNYGGDPETREAAYAGITSPGNAPSAITVGALDTLDSAARADDTVAWYSSRGPTWYDAFQKPDLVAPGSHLVSDVPSVSAIAGNYPGGLIKTSGTCKLTKLSGTSMAAAVVTGVVSLMLEASQANHPGQPLTPSAVKAILEYTALPMAAYDTLTQGAGALNAAGAIELAERIDPNQPVGTWWMTDPVNPTTTVDGEQLPWSQRVIWGDRVIWGNSMLSTNDPAWGLRVVWGDRVIWGNRVIWGSSSTVWDGNQVTWGSRVIWGSGLIGEAEGSMTTWGILSGTATATRVIWGNLASLDLASTSVSWGNLERANGDLVAK